MPRNPTRRAKNRLLYRIGLSVTDLGRLAEILIEMGEFRETVAQIRELQESITKIGQEYGKLEEPESKTDGA